MGLIRRPAAHFLGTMANNIKVVPFLLLLVCVYSASSLRYNTRKHKSLKPLGIQTAWTENDIASAHDILDALRHKGKVVEKPEKDHHKGKAAHTPEKDRHKHKAAPAPKKDRHNNKAAHAPEKDRHQRKVVDKPEKGHHAHKMARTLEKSRRKEKTAHTPEKIRHRPEKEHRKGKMALPATLGGGMKNKLLKEYLPLSQIHYREILSDAVRALRNIVHRPWWITEKVLFGALTFGDNFGLTKNHVTISDGDIDFMIEIKDEAEWTRITADLRKELLSKPKSKQGWSWNSCRSFNHNIAPVRKYPKLLCETSFKTALGSVHVDFHSYVVSEKLNRIAMDPVCLENPVKCKTHWPFQAWGGAAPYRGLIADSKGKISSKVKFGPYDFQSVHDPVALLKKFNDKEYGNKNFHLQFQAFCLSGKQSDPVYVSKQLDQSPEATLALCEKSLALHYRGYSAFNMLYSDYCKKEKAAVKKHGGSAPNKMENTCKSFSQRRCKGEAPFHCSGFK